MGAYSTLMFTRTRALSILKEALDDPSLSEEKIGDMMDAILKDQLYNATVYPDHLSTVECEGHGEER